MLLIYTAYIFIFFIFFFSGEKREAISLNPDPKQWLTVLSGGSLGNCGETRSQVRFGMEVRSGCVVEVTQTDLSQCNKLQQKFLDLLLGPILQEAGERGLFINIFMIIVLYRGHVTARLE